MDWAKVALAGIALLRELVRYLSKHQGCTHHGEQAHRIKNVVAVLKKANDSPHNRTVTVVAKGERSEDSIQV